MFVGTVGRSMGEGSLDMEIGPTANAHHHSFGSTEI